MIVELFGPPAAGKTTFARGLVARMQAEGLEAELVSSYRPAERARASAPGFGPAVLRRLARPVAELAAMSRDRSGADESGSVAAILLRMFPPRSLLWSVRLRQYLVRLDRAWHEQDHRDRVVVFDQGFVQAIGSLVLLARGPVDHAIAPALDLIPQPGLLVWLDTPLPVLEQRLIARRQRLSRAERWLELDLATNLRSARILADLHAELRRRWGAGIVPVDGGDAASLAAGMHRVLAAVAGRPVGAAPNGQSPAELPA